MTEFTIISFYFFFTQTVEYRAADLLFLACLRALAKNGGACAIE